MILMLMLMLGFLCSLHATRWEAATRIFLHTLCRDALACVLEAPSNRPVLAPADAQRPDLAPLDVAGAQAARNALFALLGQPRPLDAATALLNTLSPIEANAPPVTHAHVLHVCVNDLAAGHAALLQLVCYLHAGAGELRTSAGRGRGCSGGAGRRRSACAAGL
jgi:hypothetical protein